MYWDKYDVANIFYRTEEYGAQQYKNILYLDIDIGKPEYQFSEEGEEDGQGKFSPDFKRLEKEYLLQGVFPEYLVDALALIQLHIGGTGVVEVLTQRGYTGVVDKMVVSPDWQDDYGVWALTDIVFSTEFLTKVNCSDSSDVPVQTCVRQFLEVVATLTEDTADFNNFQYTSLEDSSVVPLVDGDLILLYSALNDTTLLRKYNESNSSYDTPLITHMKGDAVVDMNVFNGGSLSEPTYYYYGGTSGIGWVNDPVLTDITFNVNPSDTQSYSIEGHVYSDSLVQVILNTNSAGTEILHSMTGQEFNDTGHTFIRPSYATSVFIRAIGIICNLGDSNNMTFTGIAIMIVGFTNIVG